MDNRIDFGFGNEIDELLRGILDDNPKPTAAQSVAINAAKGSVANAVFADPKSFVTDEQKDEAKAAMAIAEVTQWEQDGTNNRTEAVRQVLGIKPELAPALQQIAAEEMDPELYEATDKVTTIVTGPFTDSEITGETAKRIPMPVFTDSDIMDTLDIRNYATLVTLNTSRWHAKVKDRKASQDAAAANDAHADAFETRKRLLVGADEKLKRIHQAIDAARTAHYQMTLPWSATGLEDYGKRVGGRLLPNSLFMEYTTVMAKARKEMVDALDDFEPSYPLLIQQSRQKLGKRFDIREYPNPSAIRQHFSLSFDFQPIPQGDDFKGLAATQTTALADALNKKTRTMLENAMQDAWGRLHEVVAHAAERFSSPDKTFHYTLVEKLRDTAKLIKHLNVTQDPRIEEIRKFVEKNLTMHDVGSIKQDGKLRAHLGRKAREALAMMRSKADA